MFEFAKKELGCLEQPHIPLSRVSLARNSVSHFCCSIRILDKLRSRCSDIAMTSKEVLLSL